MIETPASASAEASGTAPHRAQARLPVPAGVGRFLVLVAVFFCAACGLVYELELLTLATHLTGESVTQTSVVLSVMVFSMGLGSLLAKRLCHRAAAGFGVVEALLALVGGGSAMAMYASFAWLGDSRVALVGFSLAIGVLTGVEMPLLMTLIQRVRRQDPGGAVADLFAADYVGALVGGLAFPFLLLPLLGQLSGALLVGMVNAVAGGAVVLWLFRGDLSRWTHRLLLLANGLVLLSLAAGTLLVGPFERAARQAVYGGGVRAVLTTDVQEVVVAGGARRTGGGDGGGGLELFLDGRLHVCGADERHYHEALVHPAMAAGPRTRVLVVGDGDGLALREVLRHRGVEAVTVVEPDPEVVELARDDPVLSRLNHGAYDDPRVRVETDSAFDWLRARTGEGRRPYDVVVADLPGPGAAGGTRLYSLEFFGLVHRALGERGRLVVHAGAPSAHPGAYWTVEATLRAAGLRTAPYVVDRRPAGAVTGADCSRARAGTDGAERPGDWGLVLAGRGFRPPLALDPAGPRPHAVAPRDLRRAAARAEDVRVAGLPVSTLTRPRYRG